MKDVLLFIQNNYVLIFAVILFLYKTSRDYGIIKSDKLDALYREAVAFGEQLKKTTTISNSGIKTAVWEYINKRTSFLYTPDEDKIEAVLNQVKTETKQCL